MNFLNFLLGMLGGRGGGQMYPGMYGGPAPAPPQQQAPPMPQLGGSPMMNQPTGAQQLAQAFSQNQPIPGQQQQNPQAAAMQALLPMLQKANAPQKKSLFGDTAFSDFARNLPTNLASTFRMVDYLLGGKGFNPMTPEQYAAHQGQGMLSASRNTLNRNQGLNNVAKQAAQLLGGDNPFSKASIQVDPKTGNIKVNASGEDPSTVGTPTPDLGVEGLNLQQRSAGAPQPVAQSAAAPTAPPVTPTPAAQQQGAPLFQLPPQPT